MPTGPVPQGQMPQGQMPPGQMTQGQVPQGQMPPGQMTPGQMPARQMPPAGQQVGRPGMTSMGKTQIIVPESVKGKWSSVKIVFEDKVSKGSRNTL